MMTGPSAALRDLLLDHAQVAESEDLPPQRLDQRAPGAAGVAIKLTKKVAAAGGNVKPSPYLGASKAECVFPTAPVHMESVPWHLRWGKASNALCRHVIKLSKNSFEQ